MALGKGAGVAGRCSEREFLQCQNMMGSLQTNMKVWVCQVSPVSGYGGLDTQVLFSVEFQANSNTVLYPSSLSLHRETSN